MAGRTGGSAPTAPRLRPDRRGQGCEVEQGGATKVSITGQPPADSQTSRGRIGSRGMFFFKALTTAFEECQPSARARAAAI